jgi:hypothetical protein
MLDFIGTVATAGLLVFLVATLAVTLDMPRPAKLIFAGFAGLWTGLAAAAAAAGWLAIAQPFPVIGLFVATPMAAAAIAAAFPAGRQAMLSLPMPLLVGVNVGRIVGFLFLMLAVEGRLAGPFPYSAAIGDIITGLGALALLAAGPTSWTTGRVVAWNIFGAADLVVAIALGVMSAQGSPLQVFHDAPGSAAMQTLPWSLVPTVLVPIYLVLHGIAWAQLRLRARVPGISPSVRAPG